MDYSLFLVIENLEKPLKDNKNLKRNMILSKDKLTVYHLGIIDYLQEWDSSKKFEKFLKVVILGRDGDKISAVEPERYRERFNHEIVNRILSPP